MTFDSLDTYRLPNEIWEEATGIERNILVIVTFPFAPFLD
jgi:hypothetical protein